MFGYGRMLFCSMMPMHLTRWSLSSVKGRFMRLKATLKSILMENEIS